MVDHQASRPSTTTLPMLLLLNQLRTPSSSICAGLEVKWSCGRASAKFEFWPQTLSIPLLLPDLFFSAERDLELLDHGPSDHPSSSRTLVSVLCAMKASVERKESLIASVRPLDGLHLVHIWQAVFWWLCHPLLMEAVVVSPRLKKPCRNPQIVPQSFIKSAEDQKRSSTIGTKKVEFRSP